MMKEITEIFHKSNLTVVELVGFFDLTVGALSLFVQLTRYPTLSLKFLFFLEFIVNESKIQIGNVSELFSSIKKSQ
jgi:hypothetical protein